LLANKPIPAPWISDCFTIKSVCCCCYWFVDIFYNNYNWSLCFYKLFIYFFCGYCCTRYQNPTTSFVNIISIIVIIIHHCCIIALLKVSKIIRNNCWCNEKLCKRLFVTLCIVNNNGISSIIVITPVNKNAQFNLVSA
jgi:hypothetical protein